MKKLKIKTKNISKIKKKAKKKIEKIHLLNIEGGFLYIYIKIYKCTIYKLNYDIIV